MIQLTQGGAYLVNGTDIVADTPEAASQIQAKTGITISKEEAAKNTMAYGILQYGQAEDPFRQAYQP